MSEPHPQKCAAAYARSVRHKNSTNNYINQADKSEALQALPFTDKVALQQSKDEAMKGARRSAEFVHESAHVSQFHSTPNCAKIVQKSQQNVIECRRNLAKYDN